MGKTNFKPRRMNTVNPYLMVDNVGELIEFTKEVFGAKLNFKLNRPNGQIMHAELSIGDSVVMAGEPMKKFGTFPCSLFLYTEDCDSIYQKAIDYGCKSIMEPTTMRHAGERYGGVIDKTKNIWWIATHIENVEPEEQAKRIQEMKENWAGD